MKKQYKRFLDNRNTSRLMALVLSLLLCISIIGIIASAASVTKDGLEVTLTTDKEEYSAEEPIVATLTVENKGNKIIDEVNLETLIPDGYHIESSSNATKHAGQIGIGEKAVLAVTLLPDSNTTPETPVTPEPVTPNTPSEDGKASSNSDTNKQGNGESDNSKYPSTISPTGKTVSSDTNTLGVVSTKATTRPATQRNVGTTYQNRTSVNSSTKAVSVNTGDEPSMFWFVVLAIAGIGLVSTIWVKRRFISLLSMLVCVSVLITAIPLLAINGKAELENDNSIISVEKNIIHGGNKQKITSLVKYSKKSEDYSQSVVSLNGDFTNRTVLSEIDALSAIKEAKAYLGLDDIDNELRFVESSNIGEDSYYSFQQYYNDIPVYGRKVTLSVDGDGTVTDMVSNTIPISIEIVEDELSEVEIKDIVKTYFDTSDFLIGEQNNWVYSLNGSPVLTRSVDVSVDDGRFLIFIDIKSKGIEDSIPLISTEDEFSAVKCSTQSGKHFPGSLNKTNNVYYFADPATNIIVYSCDNNNSVKHREQLKDLVSTNDVFGDTKEEANLDPDKGVDLFNTVAGIRNYFSTEFDEKAAPGLLIGYNDSFNSGGNAYATYSDSKRELGIIMVGKKRSVTEIDVLAHEYTHLVEDTHCNLYGKGESGALKEAYADIFGELISEKLTGSLDWTIASRTIADPSKTKEDFISAPSYYQGKGFRKTDSVELFGETQNDYGNVHINSLVISHAAFLMWNGIDGNASKKIPSNMLAEMWYRSMYYLTAKANFHDCANAVYKAAWNMETITSSQLECVKEAFEKVGLGNVSEIESVLYWNRLAVRDKNGQGVDKYHLTITSFDKDEKIIDKDVDETKAPYVFELDNGFYYIDLIVDNSHYRRKINVHLNLMKDYSKPYLFHLNDDILVRNTGQPSSPGDISGVDDPEPTNPSEPTAPGDVGFASGKGTQEDPYVIMTPEQLNSVRYHLDANYVLGTDIDMSSWGNWEPIAAEAPSTHTYTGGSGEYLYRYDPEFAGFEGTFDGNGYTINNLSIATEDLDTIGLFGVAKKDSSIINLKLLNIDYFIDKSATDYNELAETEGGYWSVDVGGLVANCTDATIEDCVVSGRIIAINLPSDSNVGGTIGFSGSNINNLKSGVNLGVRNDKDSFDPAPHIQVGGIIGYSSNYLTTNCVNLDEGDISVKGKLSCFCGGITGYGGRIEKCLNYGDIDCNSRGATIFNIVSAGGISGKQDYWESHIVSCVNYGNISTNYNGPSGAGNSFSGGIVGRKDYGTVANCYNMGLNIKVLDGLNCGTISGNDDFVYENIYSRDETKTAGVPYTLKVVGLNGETLTLEEMEKKIALL